MSREMSYHLGSASTGKSTNLFAVMKDKKSKLISESEEKEGEIDANISMIKMELKTQKEVLANVNKKLVTTLQMNENLNEEKAVLQAKVEEYETEIIQLYKNDKEIKSDLKILIQENKEMREMLNEINDREEGKKSERKTIILEVEKLQIQLDTVHGQLSMEENRCESMAAALSDEKKKNKLLELDVEFLTNEMKNLEQDLQTEEKWRKEAQRKVQETPEIEKHFQESVNQLNQKLKEEEREKKNALAKVVKLESYIKTLNQESRSDAAERENFMQDEIDKLKKALAEQSKRSEVLSRRLEKKNVEELRNRSPLTTTPPIKKGNEKDKINKSKGCAEEENDNIPLFMRM